MNLISLLEGTITVVKNIERFLFNRIVRQTSHTIERLTGFNNFDHAYGSAIALCTLGFFGFFKALEYHCAPRLKLIFEGKYSWDTILTAELAVCIFFFGFSKYVLDIAQFRKRMFNEGRLEEMIMSTSITERTLLGIMALLSIYLRWRSPYYDVRFLLIGVSIMYIGFGLAKTEPYYNKREQGRRITPLWCICIILCITLLAILHGICTQTIPGVWALSILVLLILIGLVMSKVGKIHDQERCRHGNRPR